jgi:acyl dehydratase
LSKLVFTQKPSVPWFRLLLTPRSKLKNDNSIPKIEAQWNNVTIPDVSSYNIICGYPDTFIPITYPQVLATPLHMQILADKKFPLPALGLVHLYQEMEYLCPIEMEEEYDIYCWVEGHEQVANGVQFEIHTELRSEQTIYWKGKSRIYSRAAPGNKIRTERTPEPKIENPNTKNWSLPEDLGRRYTSISGDFNPIHLYSWTAKPFGFSTHIIHGMWSMAHALSSFNQPITKVQTHFIRPIHLPSKVNFFSQEIDNSRTFIARNPDNGKTHLWGIVSTQQ